MILHKYLKVLLFESYCWENENTSHTLGRNTTQVWPPRMRVPRLTIKVKKGISSEKSSPFPRILTARILLIFISLWNYLLQYKLITSYPGPTLTFWDGPHTLCLWHMFLSKYIYLLPIIFVLHWFLSVMRRQEPELHEVLRPGMWSQKIVGSGPNLSYTVSWPHQTSALQ